MLSEIPIDLEIVDKKDIDKELMRLSMIAELDAVNLYEQMAALTDDEDLKQILLDVAREEMIHVAMFQTVLMEVDDEYLKVLAEYSLAKE
ncbi:MULTISPECIES: ferritin family protein [Methanococcoides]|uniref:Methyltransferase n=2 Tax=Methanococcoides TaxID=2225 RepID=A0A0E3SQZ2_METMT|nr:ferritin family protein [Methanococcoides methylutens]AKB85186.1 Methyltransferase [Methanococcoides methylutens MM1]